MEIVEPRTESELDEVRRLIRAFVGWARVRYARELEFVERYFDEAAFEAELRSPPGKYPRPQGRLLLARSGGAGVGCVALRDLGGGYCEMKRLYVDPAAHGQGVGRALVGALIREARLAGYAAMRLDTGPGQPEAQTLYRSVGFRTIAPYYDMPPELRDWLVFMELPLRAASAAG